MADAAQQQQQQQLQQQQQQQQAPIVAGQQVDAVALAQQQQQALLQQQAFAQQAYAAMAQPLDLQANINVAVQSLGSDLSRTFAKELRSQLAGIKAGQAAFSSPAAHAEFLRWSAAAVVLEHAEQHLGRFINLIKDGVEAADRKGSDLLADADFLAKVRAFLPGSVYEQVEAIIRTPIKSDAKHGTKRTREATGPCEHCGKNGHDESSCWRKRPYLAPSSWQSRFAGSSGSASSSSSAAAPAPTPVFTPFPPFNPQAHWGAAGGSLAGAWPSSFAGIPIHPPAGYSPAVAAPRPPGVFSYSPADISGISLASLSLESKTACLHELFSLHDPALGCARADGAGVAVCAMEESESVPVNGRSESVRVLRQARSCGSDLLGQEPGSASSHCLSDFADCGFVTADVEAAASARLSLNCPAIASRDFDARSFKEHDCPNLGLLENKAAVETALAEHDALPDASVSEQFARLEDERERLAERERVVVAPVPLARIMKEADRKKLFAWRGMTCKFCAKKGHDFHFCPSRPNEPPKERRTRFADELIAAKRVDIAGFEKLSLDDVMSHVRTHAESLNVGNPWAESKASVDRLRANLGMWKAIGCDRVVLSWLAYGVPVRLAVQPARWRFTNHKSAIEHMDFVRKEVSERLADGTFVRATAADVRVVNPLQVEPKGEKGWRMCTDMRFVNAFLAHPEFRLETLARNLPDVIVKGNLQITADLKSAYYSVLMDEEGQMFLAFEVDGQIVKSKVMLFGLSTAPMKFHKIMRQIVRFMRTVRLLVLNYLDDWLWSESAAKIAAVVRFVKWLLPALGFLFNQKCEWEPRSVAGFLGMLADAEHFEVRVPTEKIGRVKIALALLAARASEGQPVLVNDLRMVTGRLLSMQLAIPAVRVWTRALYAAIARAQHEIVLGSEQAEELDFWLNNIERLNGFPIRSATHELIAYTDASEAGFGFVVNSTAFAGYLPYATIGGSSTLRELAGLLEGLRLSQKLIRGKRLLIKMDSFTGMRNLVKGGGPVAELSTVVKQIWRLCDELKVDARYMWIPRERNTSADALSKLASADFDVVPHARSAVEAKMNLRQNEVDWCVPSLGRVNDAVRFAQLTGRKLLLVHPIWPSQPWWPALTAITVQRSALTRDQITRPATSGTRVSQPNWDFAVSLVCRT